MRILLLFTGVLLVSACSHSQKFNKPISNVVEISTGGVINDTVLLKLRTAKTGIDNVFNNKDNAKRVFVFVKMTGNEKLLEITNEQWPENTDNIEYTCNIVYDARGKIAMILHSPFSQSGDWDIFYKHYFNESGKTFAFERFAGFFNSGCTLEDDGVVHETTTKYYNANFELLEEDNSLTDSKKRTLNKSECLSDYDYPYEIYADLQTCIKGYELQGAIK